MSNICISSCMKQDEHPLLQLLCHIMNNCTNLWWGNISARSSVSGSRCELFNSCNKRPLIIRNSAAERLSFKFQWLSYVPSTILSSIHHFSNSDIHFFFWGGGLLRRSSLERCWRYKSTIYLFKSKLAWVMDPSKVFLFLKFKRGQRLTVKYKALFCLVLNLIIPSAIEEATWINMMRTDFKQSSNSRINWCKGSLYRGGGSFHL